MPWPPASHGRASPRVSSSSGAPAVSRAPTCRQYALSLVAAWLTLFLATVVANTAVAQVSSAVESARLETVRERGALRCGSAIALPGFSIANSLGEYAGLDIDFCKAVAAAVFGDATALEIVPLDLEARFAALLDDRVDLLARNTTWTLEREARYGDFAGVNFYDGQAFLVPVASGVQSALELDRARICVASATTTEQNTAEFFEVNEMRYRPVDFTTNTDAAEAFEAGECDALTGDRSALAGYRSTFERPDAWRILPEVVSKEPLGPMTPRGDRAWSNVVAWTLHCLVTAEELGITQAAAVSDETAVEAATSPAARRLLGLDGSLGELLGLDRRWCADAIAAVGNYGESYERHVGPDTPLGLSRGVNALWTDGGLLYAPPMR